MKTNINKRIEILFSHLPYNQNEIAEKLKASTSRISNITKNRNKPNSDLLINILKNFRNVNAYWLLLGEGKMIIDDPSGIDYNKLKYHIGSGSNAVNEGDIDYSKLNLNQTKKGDEMSDSIPMRIYDHLRSDYEGERKRVDKLISALTGGQVLEEDFSKTAG